MVLETVLAIGALTASLSQELARRAPVEFVPVSIVMRQAPDYDAMDREAANMSRPERRGFVVSRARAEAERTQAGILGELDRLAAAGQARKVRSLWIAGAVAAELTPEGARRLAARPDVIAMDYDGEVEMSEIAALPDPPHPSSIAWNVEWIGAPVAWSSGYDGAGVLVAILDTGIWYPHSDLTGRMHRNAGDPWPPDGVDNDGNGYVDDYYGYDLYNRDRDPIDDNGHGTHCAGTVAGDGSGGTQTGVAPGSELLAVKVLGAGGSSTPSLVAEGIQYAIAGGADVMNLAFGWLAPSPGTRGLLRMAGEGARVAGVAMCAQVGGDRGSGPPPPDLVRTPGDIPPPWIHPDVQSTGAVGGVITVGATGYMSDGLASFSSNGPVRWNTISPWFDWDAPYLLKPDLAAPGINIPSTVLGGGYAGGIWSGTAMATAHVTGLVALMLSKSPGLIPARVDETMELNALPLGAPGKDNDYGSGRIRVPETMAAVTDTRTGISDGGGAAVQRLTETALAPSIPNPVSSRGTVIRFSLASRGATSLRIFDVTGETVRTLARGELTAGSHETRWDGRDDRDRPVSAGVYYCRLETVDRTVVRKIAVLP